MSVSLRDDVERWLVHEGYSFELSVGGEDIFRFTIRHVGSFGGSAEIFEPKGQPGVLVVGTRTPLSNSQNARYIKMNPAQRQGIDDRIGQYCKSIRAVHRMLTENGKRIIGTYIVFEDGIDGMAFAESLLKVADMSDRVSRYLIKTL